MAILTQFLLRLAFGLSAAMALISPRQVSSGYFRNHLYVLLGLNVLAVLTVWKSPDRFIELPAAAAALSYVGSVVWLYEKPRTGRVILAAVSALDLIAACFVGAAFSQAAGGLRVLSILDPISGGAVLGTTLAAMFLGHWYLNSPTMELAPLRRLIWLLMAAVGARAVICAVGFCLTGLPPGSFSICFIVLRWLFGICGPLLLAWMALRTLDIPNTQSATGILYVAVIAVFTGELCSELLSHGSHFPL